MARQRTDAAKAAGEAGKTGAAKGKMLRITQVRSIIGYDHRQRLVLAGLGLTRPGRSVLREDTPSIRGMCAKIGHVLTMEEVES